jgi:hypothetical protein
MLAGATDVGEGHFLRRAGTFFFPLVEQRGISIRNVLVWPNAQSTRRSVDPAGGAFDLPKVTDWRFIDHYVALVITPFGAKFLVLKDGNKAQGLENRFQFLAVAYAGFGFHSDLVPAFPALGFMRQKPVPAISPQAEQLPVLSKPLVRKVVQDVYFMSALCDSSEAQLAQVRVQGAQILDTKFDLDFLLGGHGENGSSISESGRPN